MKHPEFERVRTSANRLAAKWQKRLDLQDWDVRFDFTETIDIDGDSNAAANTMSTTTQAPYLKAEITVSLPAVVLLSNADLERLIVHELVHVRLSPEQELLDDDNPRHVDRFEYTTETLTKVLLKAYA